MKVRGNSTKKAVFVSVGILMFAVAAVLVRSQGQRVNPAGPQSNASAAPKTTVELTGSQLNSIQIEPVGKHEFPEDKETIGSISFADDLSVQVFPPFQGKIIRGLVQLGDHVQKGQPLYTVDSPDLIQAESNLISAAGVFDMATKELARTTDLRKTNGVSERELEQATSDQQTAEGALKAARDAVRVFGKTEAEIDHIIASRKVDPALVVRSPITGQITSYNAPPGLFVQPGNGTPPYTVANVGVKWMLASIIEADVPLYHVGQRLAVKVMAYPDRVFQGRISKVYPSLDLTTHRGTVRSEVSDPRDELRPGMLANFTIRVKQPVEAVGVPAKAVVREGDGTMTAWVTTDRRHFSQRVVKVGLRTDDRVEILEGLQPGELVVSDGAVFLSNMLHAPAED